MNRFFACLKTNQLFLFVGTAVFMSSHVNAVFTCPEPSQIQCYFSEVDSACVGPGLEWLEVSSDPRPLKTINGYGHECSYGTNTGEILVFYEIPPPPEKLFIDPENEEDMQNLIMNGTFR